MSSDAMDAHFAATGAKLIADAGPLVGKCLQCFHIDSWELGQPTWTPRMRNEFQQRRGYDLLTYLPALLDYAGTDPPTNRRFLADYRRTATDLVASNYYGRLRELAVKGGLRGTHPESGGPFFEHWIDALQCEGINDIAMSHAWLTYLARCQFLLRKGRFVADIGQRQVGLGRVVWGRTLAEVVKADDLPPDVEVRTFGESPRLDWIHRRDGDVEIYFVANLSSTAATADAVFRISGKQPELWDAVTGEIGSLPDWHYEAGRTVVPLAVAPRQSWFILFRKAAVPAVPRRIGISQNWKLSRR
jgi:hypothetical protein